MVETWLLQNLLSPHHLFQILVTNHRYNTKYASLIGFCYNWGLGTEINGELAIHFYTIAARKNDHSAAVQNELGWMYEFGFGTEKNPKLAFQYFRKSARQGLPNAQNSLGECYHFGLGTEIDLEKAFSWYSRAAKSECADGQFHLAECYQLGLGCKRDLDLALFWYHLSSSSYNKNESLDYHGKEHDLETNISNSMVLKGMQGFTWFIRAAKAGDARAQRVVGDYYRGWSFNKLNSDENDDSNSISDGRSEGRNKSAEFFSSRNSKTAFKWYEKSASAGNVTAKRRVGLCYRNGIGCEVDLKKSLKCFKEAAELGSWNGMADYEVAWCYQFGIGVEKDIHEGMKWYVCSAKKGYLKGWIEAKKLMAGLMIGNESGTFCRR
ncbi:hypothetical protein G9A89_017643 [Geosiphon pyriformis]|nr:hypothetical protein G9A89_017643 [Geosiphon pyriformis]